MKIVFVRHGEPDYAPCYERGFIGQGLDLACLTPIGIEQAEAVSRDTALDGSELIISSPYTRALQTAAIISRNTQLNIAVEIDLHEFLLDKTFQRSSQEESDMLHRDFVHCLGCYPEGESKRWESVNEVKRRARAVMMKYLQYDKVIVVAHGGVISRFTGTVEIKYCTPYIVDFGKDFVCHDWIVG